MSRLRPTLRPCRPDEPSLTYEATYFRVLDAVNRRRALCHGHLDAAGLHCALGCYFADASIALPSRAIDEIAAYNDSFPRLTPPQRWRKVVAWLRHRAKVRA